MDVTRDVILDLLPLYLGGEASPGTRALVEDWLRGDPELARLVREQPAALARAGAAPPPELEMRTLRRTHAVLAWQRWTFGLGIACLAVALSLRVTFHPGALPDVRLVMLDAPLPLGTLFAAGVVLLAIYRRLRRATGRPH